MVKISIPPALQNSFDWSTIEKHYSGIGDNILYCVDFTKNTVIVELRPSGATWTMEYTNTLHWPTKLVASVIAMLTTLHAECMNSQIRCHLPLCTTPQSGILTPVQLDLSYYEKS